MDDGKAAAAAASGLETYVEKSAEGAAAGEADGPGPGPTPPAAAPGLTSDTKAVTADDAVGGEISSSSRDQGLVGPAVGEPKEEREFAVLCRMEGFGCAFGT